MLPLKINNFDPLDVYQTVMHRFKYLLMILFNLVTY